MPPPRGTNNVLEGPGDYDVTSKVHSDTYPEISPLRSPATEKSVFVVGASRGIGLAIAISFAQSGASQIALGARSNLSAVKEAVLSAAEKANRPAPKVICVNIDITSESSVQDAASAVEKEFGNLDILLINSGVIGSMKRIVDSNPDEWWETWMVNVRGPYLLVRALLPLLLKGGDKMIITTSSVGAHLTGDGLSDYQMTKTAQIRLMDFVSVEYGDQGIVSYSIHPGNVPTDMIGGSEGVEKIGLTEVFTETPELAGDTLVFLTKEKRSWLTGRYVNVMWDMPELIGKKDYIVKGNKLKVKLDF
ncbi:hypothetical protein HYFRA_00003472 [Hymenoscyphus fraxineus]|uniref:Uncharacterized protein n=1 Tax=Hymenoscyphus fraxineus TaxID=746836 RepID=A0A9N9KUS6_9HELO|nr:hypothetical protein HYFRA_00003472 [Hymenoscyphus fraxineus]